MSDTTDPRGPGRPPIFDEPATVRLYPRLPPRLATLARQAARRSGLSLAEWCARRLAAAAMAETSGGNPRQ